MSRKNGKNLLIAVAVGAVVVKAVRGCHKGKKSRRKNSGLLWMIFYEEELNWWDREHEKGEEL